MYGMSIVSIYSNRVGDEELARRALLAIRADGGAKFTNDALVHHVAKLKLAHRSIPRRSKIEELGLSMGLKVVDPKRILEDAEKLAQETRHFVSDAESLAVAGNGDYAIALALANREWKAKILAETKADAPAERRDPAPAERKHQRPFDLLELISYPLMLINGLCAFLIMGAFNVCIAVAKTFKGETVK